MLNYLVDNPITIATLLSAIAAIFSAIATWQGPRSAAKLAERIRKDTEREVERRRMKLQVFSTLMQERATITSIQSVQMLNSIDFVFSDSSTVREAWADLYAQFGAPGGPHPQLQEEKLRVLLKMMGSDIGLSDTLKVDDIARIYYPNALAQQQELDMLQRDHALRSFRSQWSARQQEVEAPISDKFPPKPK